MRFDWDPRKAKENLRKHKISFEEAATVFFDDLAQVASDPDHSDEEDRFIIVGLSANNRLLIVVHCLREDGDLIRLISARKLTAKERSQYENS